ncbi:hypothetical protein SORBI_3009G120000 [Sorghum bicolor]|uniref:Uncharacterized protein n=1 Tax=Sorghum bicolor TaxID=4558 RepID=A0A1B6P7Z0_SORBI|nr:hypothetical protein SORBI_3009G120000 [Sorghum bicolor]
MAIFNLYILLALILLFVVLLIDSVLRDILNLFLTACSEFRCFLRSLLYYWLISLAPPLYIRLPDCGRLFGEARRGVATRRTNKQSAGTKD